MLGDVGNTGGAELEAGTRVAVENAIDGADRGGVVLRILFLKAKDDEGRGVVRGEEETAPEGACEKVVEDVVGIVVEDLLGFLWTVRQGRTSETPFTPRRSSVKA